MLFSIFNRRLHRVNDYAPYLRGFILGFLSATALARLVLWPYVRKITADEIAGRINDARYRLYWNGDINRGESNAIVAIQGSIWRHDDDSEMEQRIKGNVSYLNARERAKFAGPIGLAKESQ